MGYLLLLLRLYCFWCRAVLFWYPFWLQFPGFWGNVCKFFELLKEGLYNWKEILDVEKSFLFVVTFIILFGKSSPKRNSESAGTFFLNAWYWSSRQYAIWPRLFCLRSVFTWLSSASESVQSWTIVLKFLFRVVVFKILLFFNSINWVKHYINYYTSKFFPYWWTCFSTGLKLLAISLIRSSSSLSSGSDSSLFAKLTFGLLVVSKSWSICSSKSEPPYKDSSSSAGWWLSLSL